MTYNVSNGTLNSTIPYHTWTLWSLVLQVWCCVVKHQSCLARPHNNLEWYNFCTTIYSFSIPCMEHQYCGDQQWRSLT